VLTWTVDGQQTDIGPGEVLSIPRGVAHSFDNPHDADASALAIVTPGILGPDYFREVAAVIDAAAGGPPDLAALGTVMRRPDAGAVAPARAVVPRPLSWPAWTRRPPDRSRCTRAACAPTSRTP
jgi:hypothetical protein